jgi:Protein of unknown function (DUF2490).
MKHSPTNTSCTAAVAIRAAAAALLISAAALNANASSKDTQARLGTGASFDVGSGFKVDVATEQRFNQDVGEYYYQEYDVGVSYSVNKYVSVAPLMRFAETRKTDPGADRSWSSEYRPMINVSLSYTWEGWKFEDRNRVEFRLYEGDTKDITRYRNRLKISSPWKWSSLKINPYASAEIFQDCNGTKTALQNYEAAIGFSAAISSSASLDLFYMAEYKEDAKKHSTPQSADILGASVKFKF